VAYFTVVTSQREKVAQALANHGFTLKKPYHYSKGHQRGLIVQSIKLKNGQYFQIVSLDPKKTRPGALAKWYQKLIPEPSQGKLALGATLVLKDNPISLKEIHRCFERAKIPSQLESQEGYLWLSFKTHSDYAPLSFIEQTHFPADNPELTQHANGAEALGKIQVRPQGDPKVWSQILSLSQSTEAMLEFATPSFQERGLITQVEVVTKKKPLPPPVNLGYIQLNFIAR